MSGAPAAALPALNPDRLQASRRRIERLAWVLDGALRIPGTRLRFGVDFVIGLVPGLGDAVGLLLGAALLVEGLRLGVPRRLLLRMGGNCALDALVGVLPVAGDLFDLAFRANRRNADLLLAHLDAQLPPPAAAPAAAAQRGTRLLGALLVALLIAVALIAAWLSWRLLAAA